MNKCRTRQKEIHVVLGRPRIQRRSVFSSRKSNRRNVEYETGVCLHRIYDLIDKNWIMYLTITLPNGLVNYLYLADDRVRRFVDYRMEEQP